MKEFVVHQLLQHALITYPEQVIVSDGKRFTYREFYSRVLRIANSMKILGIKKGSVVGVLDVNTNRFLEMHYACSMLGAILHTINFRLTPEQMLYSMIHAGDIGYFHTNHSIYVADREGDAIKSGGEWIPTGILETILSENLAIQQVAVIPKNDKNWGQRPVVIVKTKLEITERELKDFLLSKVNDGKLAKFWIPDQFIFVDEIPLTSAGKLNKRALRDKYSDEKQL